MTSCSYKQQNKKVRKFKTYLNNSAKNITFFAHKKNLLKHIELPNAIKMYLPLTNLAIYRYLSDFKSPYKTI